MGLRSPVSHGVKSTRWAPGGDVAASASISAYDDSGATAARNHSRARPALSWLLASRYCPSPRPGIDAICRMTSDFFAGTGQLIHAEVPSERWGRSDVTQPEATAALCRSGVPVTTRASAGMPIAAATSGSTVPTIEPLATSGGSRVGVHPGEPDQGRVVGQHVEVAVVGQPGGGHRHQRRGGDAGEPHRQVVDRLEVPPRGGRDLGPVAVEVQHVGDRVGPGGAGDAAAAPQPGGQRPAASSPRPDRRTPPRSAPRRGCRSTSGTPRPGGRTRRRAPCSPTGRSPRPRRRRHRRRRPRRSRDGPPRRSWSTTPRRPGPRRRSRRRSARATTRPVRRWW